MTQPGFPTAQTYGNPCSDLTDAANQTWVRTLADRINGILGGKMNCVLPVTLAANAASTTVKDVRIGGYSTFLWQPLTTHAWADLVTAPYILVTSQQTGQAIFAHANNANSDKNFNLVIIG